MPSLTRPLRWDDAERPTQESSMRASLRSLLILVVVLGLPPAAAWAHGDIESAHPAQGSRMAKPPREVSVHLAEPPAQGSTLVVTDGCKEEVGGEAQIDGEMFTVPIDEGRPGRWNVKVRSISSVDGHLVRESFSFTVRGKKDCSAEDPPEGNGDTAGDDEEVQLGDPQPPLQNEETSFPIVPFALGTVVVVALAIALRRSGKNP